MSNEFIIKNGFISKTNSTINGNLTITGTTNTLTGYSKDGTSLLLDHLKSGSIGAAGTIPVSNGSTSTPSWSSVYSAIATTPTQNYIARFGATKLENSTIQENTIGIGIGGPASYTLDVSKSSNSGLFATFPTINVSNTLALQGDGTSTYNFSSYQFSAGNGVVKGVLLASYNSDVVYGNEIQFRTTSYHNMSFWTNSVRRMTILNSGSVGIGTTGPGAKLEIANIGVAVTPVLRLNSGLSGGNTVDINPFVTGVLNSGFEILVGGINRLTIRNDGNMGIGTTDLDGTPAIGRLTVKGSTNNGTTNALVLRDSDEVNITSVNTNGDIITSGTITASSATTDVQVINLGQLKDKVKSGSIDMVTGTWPIYFEKSFPTAGYVTSVWGIDSLGNEVGINVVTQYDYGFEIEVPEDCTVKFDCTYPESPITYLDNMWYGISYVTTNPSPTLTRIGNANLHKVLPIQNKMKGCLLTDAITVNYYLDPLDWSKNITGGTSNLDGTDGQVMIEKPTLYWKFETSGTTNYVKISEYPLAGFSQKPKCYIGAYEAALQRSNSKLASVVNTTTDFRGGNNTSAWDAASNSLLGKPATNYHIVDARTYARNRGTGWNQLIYDNYMELFWLFAIEYATFNSQLAVNSTLTSQGYKQGGLGNGVSTANGTEWTNFNTQNPFINCGASNSLGSGSGEVSVNITDFGGTGVTRTFTVNRYRGVENPFGHIWKFVDGLNVYNNSGVTTMYIIDNPSNLASDTQTNSRTAGVIAQVEGYGKTMLFGSSGDIVPSVTIENMPTTYLCDYFYPNLTANNWKISRLGGTATGGSSAGFLYSNFSASSSSALTSVGSRLSAR